MGTTRTKTTNNVNIMLTAPCSLSRRRTRSRLTLKLRAHASRGFFSGLHPPYLLRAAVLMDFLSNGTPIPAPADASVRVFVSPVGSFEQLTLLDVYFSGCDVLVRIPSPASAPAPFSADACSAHFAALLSCFPTTSPRVNAWDDSDDDTARDTTGFARVRGALPSDAGPPPSSATSDFSLVNATNVAAALGGAAPSLPAAASEWAYLVTRGIAGGGPTRATVAVVHARPRDGGLWLPLRTRAGVGARAKLNWLMFNVGGLDRPEGGWASAGTTPSEHFSDLRRRLATGSYRELMPPQRTWADVVDGGGWLAALPRPAAALQLRRRIGFSAPTEDVELDACDGVTVDVVGGEETNDSAPL